MSELFAAGGPASVSTLPITDPLGDPLAEPVTDFPSLPLNIEEMQAAEGGGADEEEVDGTISFPPPMVMAGRVPAPLHWLPMLDTSPVERYHYYMQVPLSPGSQRFNEIFASLRKGRVPYIPMTMLGDLEISQIQHPRLYERFYQEAEALGIPLDSPMIERCFHGCAVWSVDSIMREGLDKGYGGINGSNYGRGIYCGRDLRWALRSKYSVPDQDGSRHIFVCDVIAGNSQLGHVGLRSVGYDSSKGIMYHSACDHEERPSIRVMFKEDRVVVTDLVKFTMKPLEDFLLGLFMKGLFSVRKALINMLMGYYDQNPDLWVQEEMEAMFGKYSRERMRTCAFLQGVRDDNVWGGHKVETSMGITVLLMIHYYGMERFIKVLPPYIASNLKLRKDEGNKEADAYNLGQLMGYWKNWSRCFTDCQNPEVKVFKAFVVDTALRDSTLTVKPEEGDLEVYKELTGKSGVFTCSCKYCIQVKKREEERQAQQAAMVLAQALAQKSSKPQEAGSSSKPDQTSSSYLKRPLEKPDQPSSSCSKKVKVGGKRLGTSDWDMPDSTRQYPTPFHFLGTDPRKIGPYLTDKSVCQVPKVVEHYPTMIAATAGRYATPGGFLYTSTTNQSYCNFGRGLLEYSKNGGRNNMVMVPAFIPCQYDAERTRVDPMVGYDFMEKGPLGTGYYLKGVLEHFKANEGKDCTQEVVDSSTGVAYPVDPPTVQFMLHPQIVGFTTAKYVGQGQSQAAGGGGEGGGAAAAGAPVVAQGAAGLVVSGPSVPAPQSVGVQAGPAGGVQQGGPVSDEQQQAHARAASRGRRGPAVSGPPPSVVPVPVPPPVSDVPSTSGGSGSGGEGAGAQP